MAEQEENKLAAEKEIKEAALAEEGNEVNKKKSRSNKKDKKEEAKMVYRPKAPKEEIKEPEAVVAEPVITPQVVAPVEPEVEAPKKKDKPKKERKEKPEPAPVVEAAPVEKAVPVSAPKVKKSVEVKPATPSNSQVASLQQLLLAKENEMF